jgi:hypothetical protein
MSTPLILDSLEIESFRAFKHLRIDRLGRVNLVTGRNNVGKSYLLEALWVYAHRGSAWEILQLMQQRDEVQLGGYFGLQGEEIDLDEQISNIRHIFYGRKDVQEHASPIKIGAIHKPHASLLIEVGSLSSTGTGEPGQRQLQLFEPGMYGVENQLLALVAQIGMEEPEYYPLNRYFGRRLPQVRDKKKPIPSTFIRANGLDP